MEVGIQNEEVQPPPLTLHTSDKPIHLDSPAAMSAAQEAECADADPPLRIFVFDNQRTSGQLFSRHFLSHLQFGTISHPYAVAATLGPERIQRKLQNSEKVQQAWDEQIAATPTRLSSLTYQDASINFLTEADRLEQKGKILFVREHASLVIKQEIILSAIHSRETIISRLTNPTCIPDELLKLITPIIFIRHPARVIPAWLREANSLRNLYAVEDDDLTLWTSARWSRMIFDHLRSNGHNRRPGSRRRRDSAVSTPLPMVSSWPIVIDAVDAVHNTHAILATLCRILDLDVQGMQDGWSPNKRFERAYDSLRKHFSDNVMKAFSTRVSSPERNSAEYRIDLDTEQKSWTKEFGKDVAQALRDKVEDDLPHYQYLRNFKLRARPSLTESAFLENVSGKPSGMRTSFDEPADLLWGDGSETGQPSGSGTSQIHRSASLGQIPMGILIDAGME